MNFCQFKSFLSSEKRKSDPFFCRYFYRPISIYLGWIFFNIGISPNVISLLSILISFVACLILISGNITGAIFAAILFLFVGISDCIDGNIARASNKLSLKGEWLDAFSGYFIYAFKPISIGIFLENSDNSFLFDGFWIISGAMISIFNLISRLIYQKSINLLIKSKKIDNHINYKKSFSFGNEIGMVGFMMPLFMLAVLSNKLEYYLFFYLIVYTFTFVFTCFSIMKKISNY